MKRRWLVLSFLVLVVAGIYNPGLEPAFADGPSTIVSTTLKLDGATETHTEGWLAVSATLTTAESRPVSGRLVNFAREVEFFGSRDVSLGTATTDATGVAVLIFQPSGNGTQVVKVSFSGDEEYAATETSGAIEVVVAPETFSPEPAAPLAAIRRWLSVGVGILVVGVCAVLLGVFVIAVYGIWNAGRALEVEQQIARQSTPSAVKTSQ